VILIANAFDKAIINIEATAVVRGDPFVRSSFASGLSLVLTKPIGACGTSCNCGDSPE
jgi:hypothetical protein